MHPGFGCAFQGNVCRGDVIGTLAERTARLESGIILLAGWKRAATAFLAGAVSALAMAPFDLFFVLFLTVPVLVWVMDGAASDPAGGFFARAWTGFKPGFFFGFGYYVAGLWWIGNALLVEAENFAWALPLAVIALPAMLAIFWGLATALAGLVWMGEVRRIFLLAACIGLLEFARGFVATGFPWNTLGYAAYFNPLTMQTASVLGVYAMTPLVVLVACLPVFLFPAPGRRTLKHPVMVLLCLLLLASHVGYGFLRLDAAEQRFVDNVALRLVQPAIDQADKFDPLREAEILQRYMDLSVSDNDGQQLSDATHLLWPESAFPFLLTQRRDVLASIAAMLPEGTSLVTGAARAEERGGPEVPDLVFNSVYAINHEGEIVSAADKVHLVPFGEYLPLQEILEKLGFEQLTKVQGGFTQGSSRKLMAVGNAPDFLPLICYEIIFSTKIWQGNIRPGWILNVTNDAWFGISPGPFQHERQAIVRAIEEGLPLVRVANSGISGVYTAYGEPVARLKLGEAGILDAALPAAAPATFFSINGKYLFWAIMGLFAVIGLIPARAT